jgi:hypothetical protein
LVVVFLTAAGFLATNFLTAGFASLVFFIDFNSFLVKLFSLIKDFTILDRSADFFGADVITLRLNFVLYFGIILPAALNSFGVKVPPVLIFLLKLAASADRFLDNL